MARGGKSGGRVGGVGGRSEWGHRLGGRRRDRQQTGGDQDGTEESRGGAHGSALLLGRCEARSHGHNLGSSQQRDDIPGYARNVWLDTHAKTDHKPSKCAAWATETLLLE